VSSEFQRLSASVPWQASKHRLRRQQARSLNAELCPQPDFHLSEQQAGLHNPYGVAQEEEEGRKVLKRYQGFWASSLRAEHGGAGPAFLLGRPFFLEA
jgi:hypothetical protein